MILEGSNIKHPTEHVTVATTKASHSIAQLILFNSVKHTRAANSSVRHRYETPTPVYMGLKIRAVTRSRNLVDALYNLNLCISYDCLFNITSKQSVYNIEQTVVVCPPKLLCGIHTSAAVDNIDHNHSASTCKLSS